MKRRSRRPSRTRGSVVAGLSLLLLPLAAACRSEAPPPSGGGRAGAAGPQPPPAAVAGAATPLPAPAPTLPALLTPDSLLPGPSIAGLPGWFMANARALPRHVGVPNDADPRAFTGVMIDSGIIVTPADTAWLRVGTLTPLTLLTGDGARTIRLEAAEPDEQTPGMLLRVRAEPAGSVMTGGPGWLLPGSARGVTALRISEATAPDGASRTWTAGPVRVQLRITGRVTAELWAERAGVARERVRRIEIDSASDSGMGVETDTLLTISNWRMPSVRQAFRFGEDGPIAVVFHESGYECSNLRLIVFRGARIEVLDEPHYYECQR